MRILSVILLFIWSVVPAFSESTCTELYAQIKESDCGSALFKWLDGSYLEVGLSFSYSQMDLNRFNENTLLSSQSSSLTPFPTLSLSFPNNYFGETGFAWGVSVGYMYNMGFDQTITRDDEKKEIDLHTYYYMVNLFANPSLFYVFGRDENSDWPYWGKVGLGLGMGLGRIKGTAYLTEDSGDSACYDAASGYLTDDLAPADIRDACAILSYGEVGVGISAAILIEFRIKAFIFSIETAALNLTSRKYSFVSAQTNLSLTYAIYL